MEFEDLPIRQQHVLRRDQLPAAGVTRSSLRAHLAYGRWQAVGSSLIVCHNGPLTEDQRRWAAVLSAGPVAALSGRTAAACAGLRGWESPTIEILVPKGRARSVARLPGVPVEVYESRHFGPQDLHPRRLPPQTLIARSVMDAATRADSPRAACGIVAAAVQQRLTTARLLLDELTRAGQVRHRGILRSALGDIEGGAQAFSEIEFGRFCRKFGLPQPVRQQMRRDGEGRRRYLDATLRGPDGRELHVEVDGGLHLLAINYWHDMHRDNELVLAGIRLLRFPSIAVRLEPERVADQIRRGLGLR